MSASTDGYTGSVTVGGPPARRDLGPLVVSKLAVGPMANNAYLLGCARTGERCLIDAANEAHRLLDLVGDRPLKRIITTHRHPDHWQALRAVVAATGARTAAGRDDAAGIAVPTEEPLDDGAVVEVGDCRLEVVSLVGHTPGSVALLYESPLAGPHLFTGDALFPGGPGRTTTVEDFTSLMDDLEEKIFGRLPDDTWFYPGHGNDSTLGTERPALPEWRARGW